MCSCHKTIFCSATCPPAGRETNKSTAPISVFQICSNSFAGLTSIDAVTIASSRGAVGSAIGAYDEGDDGARSSIREMGSTEEWRELIPCVISERKASSKAGVRFCTPTFIAFSSLTSNPQSFLEE